MQTWRRAFIRQARSDFEVFASLGTQPLCHQLHYLQMTAEKIAKALLCPDDRSRPPRTHTVFVRFLQIAKASRDLRKPTGMSKNQFREYLDGMLSVGNALENLAPVGDVDKPNTEYPWEAGGKVISPLDYPFADLRLTSLSMSKLLKFLGLCLMVAQP